MVFIVMLMSSTCKTELAVGNIVRRVLHIIREEDLSLTTATIGGLSVSAASDDEDELERGDHPALSAAAVAAASRSTLRPPSLQTLLEDVPHSAAVPHTYSSGGDSEGKSKCKPFVLISILSFNLCKEMLVLLRFSWMFGSSRLIYVLVKTI